MSYRIRIKPEWLRIDTYHAPQLDGPGGTRLNKTFSGVRVMHEGLNLKGEATEGRSQFHNRELAMQKLVDAVEKFLYPDGGLNTPKITWELTPDGRQYFDGKVMHQEFFACTTRLQLERALRFAEWEKRHGAAMSRADLLPEFKYNANRQFGKMGGLPIPPVNSPQALAYQQMMGRSFRKVTVDTFSEAMGNALKLYTHHKVESNVNQLPDKRWEVSPRMVYKDLIGNVGDIYAAD